MIIYFIIENRVNEEPIINVASHAPWSIQELTELVEKVSEFQGEVKFLGNFGDVAQIKMLDVSRVYHSKHLTFSRNLKASSRLTILNIRSFRLRLML